MQEINTAITFTGVIANKARNKYCDYLYRGNRTMQEINTAITFTGVTEQCKK